MTESEFNHIVDESLIAIEDAVEAALDDMDGDLDVEMTNGILSITFDNASKIIINRQSAADQLWVATKGGGFHFDWNGEQWISDKDQEPLLDLLNRSASEQSGEDIALELDIQV